LSSPIAPPPSFTISSVTQVPAGQNKVMVMSNVDPFSLWVAWITVSAATDGAFPSDGVETWGASIVDNNTGQTMLRCQVHVAGRECVSSESAQLFLAGLVVAEKNAPFEVSFRTDPGFDHVYTRANAGLYYGPVPALWLS
jgi:hypothetical protein